MEDMSEVKKDAEESEDKVDKSNLSKILGKVDEGSDSKEAN